MVVLAVGIVPDFEDRGTQAAVAPSDCTELFRIIRPRAFPQTTHSLSVSTSHHTPVTDPPGCPAGATWQKTPNGRRSGNVAIHVTRSTSMHNSAQRRTTNPPKKPNEPKKWGYRPRAQIGLSGQGTPNPTAKQKSGYIPGYRALHPEPAATVLQTAHGAVHRDKSDKMQHNATENRFFNTVAPRRLCAARWLLRGCHHGRYGTRAWLRTRGSASGNPC